MGLLSKRTEDGANEMPAQPSHECFGLVLLCEIGEKEKTDRESGEREGGPRKNGKEPCLRASEGVDAVEIGFELPGHCGETRRLPNERRDESDGCGDKDSAGDRVVA